MTSVNLSDPELHFYIQVSFYPFACYSILGSSGNVAVPGFVLVWLSRFDNMCIMYLQHAHYRTRKFRVTNNLRNTNMITVYR